LYYSIQQAKPYRVTELRLDGELMKRFHRVDEEATEMLIRMEEELLLSEPIPAPNDYMAAVQHRNVIRAQAEEIVLREIVHQFR